MYMEQLLFGELLQQKLIHDYCVIKILAVDIVLPIDLVSTFCVISDWQTYPVYHINVGFM